MNVALSCCPNDTYLFYPWIAGKIHSKLSIRPYFADIEQLNQWAIERKFPLIKLSFSCFSEVMDHYEALPVGAALGFGCGPKIIAKHHFSYQDLSGKTIAIPGRRTTAHFLLNRLLPEPKKKTFIPYHKIIEAIKSDCVDCGLIIHESRFTYHNEGLKEIVDLGELWHQQTHFPLPLGTLAIERTLESSVKAQIVTTLRNSLKYAKENPQQGLDFITQYSQEKDSTIIQKHIATYVTSESFSLSKEGISAIEFLLNVPKKCWFYE